MNDTQTPVESNNSQLSPTNNPQTPGGQNLSAGGSGLQNPTNIVNDSANLQITSVGDSGSAKPVTLNSTTASPSSTVPAKSHNRTYLVAGLSVLAIVIIFFFTWLSLRRKPS